VTAIEIGGGFTFGKLELKPERPNLEVSCCVETTEVESTASVFRLVFLDLNSRLIQRAEEDMWEFDTTVSRHF